MVEGERERVRENTPARRVVLALCVPIGIAAPRAPARNGRSQDHLRVVGSWRQLSSVCGERPQCTPSPRFGKGDGIVAGVHELNRRSHDATINDQLDHAARRVAPFISFPHSPALSSAKSVRRVGSWSGRGTHYFRTGYGFLSVGEDASSSSPPASSTRSRVLLSASARCSATLPKWRDFLSLMCTTTTTRRRTVGSHAVDVLTGGTSASVSSNT